MKWGFVCSDYEIVWSGKGLTGGSRAEVGCVAEDLTTQSFKKQTLLL